MQLHIFDIHDDTLFLVISHLTPLDFLSLSQTCLNFYRRSDPTKYSAINKYWQIQCQEFWSLMKKNNYTTDNYKNLFQTMAEFVIYNINIPEYMYDFIDMYNSSKYKDDRHLYISEKTLNLHQRTFGMEITVDKFVKISGRSSLFYIIDADNLKMFKIYIYNTNENYINKKLHAFPDLARSSSILFGVIIYGAIKIATYLLAPVAVNKANDDHIYIKDKNNIDKYNYNYNFPNIDILTPESSKTKDTPLTLAAHCKRVEIVSLLINHPNMTKDGINQGDNTGVVPLHCACCAPHENNLKASEQDSVSIAQMLINDERTDINVADESGDTALMYAIQYQKKVFEMLIKNDKINVNCQNVDGETALHVAAACDDCIGYQTIDFVECVKILVRRKDFNSLDIKNNDNLTALQVAMQQNFSPMIQCLKKFNDNLH